MVEPLRSHVTLVYLTISLFVPGLKRALPLTVSELGHWPITVESTATIQPVYLLLGKQYKSKLV